MLRRFFVDTAVISLDLSGLFLSKFTVEHVDVFSYVAIAASTVINLLLAKSIQNQVCVLLVELVLARV